MSSPKTRRLRSCALNPIHRSPFTVHPKMSQPAPKQSIWQILLFATVVFLAFNLFFMPKQSDPRTSDQIMQSIRSQAQTIKNRAAQEHRSIHDIITELDNGSTAKSGKIDLQTAFDQLNADQDLEQMRLLN